MEGYIGEIRLLGFSYDPRYWMACDGRRLSVKDYTPLFALIGCTFGGDGRDWFNLPKLDGPMKGLHYVICTNGIWPDRND
jgi:microcystin-dependent protein